MAGEEAAATEEAVAKIKRLTGEPAENAPLRDLIQGEDE